MTQPEGAGRDVVVSTEWLAARLGDRRDLDLRVVDVRGKILPPGSKPRYLAKRADYDASHIPGAVFVDWTHDIVDPNDPVPMQVAGPDAFASKMAELGIGDESLVVAYDDYDHIFAGRLAWALRYYGHEAVRILDGGWSRWVAEGRPTSAAGDRTTPAPGRPFVARERPALRRSADDVAGSLARAPGEVVVIEARPTQQKPRAVSAAARAGHIPGAVNVPYARLVDREAGTFLPPRELARVFEDAGVDVRSLPREIIVYCNGGVSCTLALNALRMLGRDDVAVYDGSWNEWGDDDRRPIRSGSQP
jgi:thiosulfate/3-mercaptopyruvate sulfurtransferase